jgi:hypothetical protein
MALNTQTTPKIQSTSPAPVSSIAELAKTIREGALAKALRDRRAYAADEGLLEMDLRRPAVFESMKDGLAQGVARALAAHDAHVQAVYAYDPSANSDNETGDDGVVDATLHLLVLVTTPSAALQAFIDALDQALTASLHSLPSLTFQIRESVLDINLFTPKDVEQRHGYAGLLSSIYAPAIKLWER